MWCDSCEEEEESCDDDLGIDSTFTRPGLDHLVFTLFDKINPFEDWTL